jgi:hypothetical protein
MGRILGERGRDKPEQLWGDLLQVRSPPNDAIHDSGGGLIGSMERMATRRRVCRDTTPRENVGSGCGRVSFDLLG